jgi:ATP-dependent DNA helicase RecG
MFVREINIPVSRIRGVGPAMAGQLSALGISTVGELLSYWPRDWDDRTVHSPLSAYASAREITADAEVVEHEWFGFGKMRTLKIVIKDDEGTLASLACFNRPFLEKSFPVGSLVTVHGNFQIRYGEIQSSGFDIDDRGSAPVAVLPVYSLTAGLSQTQLRKIIARAIKEYCRGIDSELPESVRAERGIPSKMEIIASMHAPRNLDEAARARNALIFEELFLFEYLIGQRSIERRGRLPNFAQANANGAGDGTNDEAEAAGTARDSSPRARNLSPRQAQLEARLPFPLTDDQIRAVDDMNRELDGGNPMARLLQGDVGSGKTLVAFFACLRVIDSGGQCAILAPTELLSRQHAENAAKLLEPIGVRIAFLTGNLKAQGRGMLLGELGQGNIDLVVGTHALFSNSVRYHNLRFVVIDEQHRFGVLQRSAIIEKGTESDPEKREPHTLMMSATPIPRTLALSVFGDLDVTVIRTMPPGRKPVITHLARRGNEQKVYDFIKRELAAGRQAYFVYPLIEGSDTLSLKSAEDMYTMIREKIFPGVPSALIHSKIPEDDQRAIMSNFRDGALRILVATSVVEVGVDVANATCMVIEHAERFGLSALHQLRGRVGRSDLQSYCFLVYADNLTEDGKARLKVMHETTDGFVIAEEDLRIRGPGDIAGIQQSGYVAFDIADPVRDAEILAEARVAAFSLLEKTLPKK